LVTLVKQLGLSNQETIFHHLSHSEAHYVDQKWDDSISQSRKFLEAILQEVAALHYTAMRGGTIPKEYDQPSRVREYLETNGLIVSKEKGAISEVYGLLSDTGAHPHIAKKDEARLMRHLALTISQYIMLKLKEYLKK